MKRVLIISLSIAALQKAQAQRLVFLPEVGVQTFKTDARSSSPLQGYKSYSSLSPTIGGRLMYISKNGHGPYVGFHMGDLTISSYDNTTSRSVGVTLYRYEAGYQWLSKPVYFKHLWDNGMNREEFENLSRKGLAVQLQPSAGLVYTRGTAGSNTYSFSGTTYNDFGYRANIGLNAGLGLMLSNNGKPFLSLSFNYTKSFGDIYRSELHSGTNSAYQTTKASGWNFGAGVPITILKKKK